MEHCSAEVWGHIFSLACTDGGDTGRSLSLVCKYVRDASSPYKYKTIALRGQKQVQAFATMLFMSAKLPRVRNLLLKDRDIRPTPASFSIAKTSGMDAVHAIFSYDLSNEDILVLMTRISACGLYNKYLDQCKEVMATIPYAFQYILPVLSPHLESLTCAASPFLPTFLPTPFPNLQFPSLVDLTFYCCRTEGLPTDAHVVPRAVPPFPAVKNLHLAFTYGSTGYLAYLAPAVNNLRITGPLNTDEPFLEDLTALISPPRCPGETSADGPYFQHLQRITLLPCRDFVLSKDQVPRWLSDLADVDEGGMVDVLEPSMQAWGSQGSVYNQRLYGYTEVDDDWERKYDSIPNAPYSSAPRKQVPLSSLRQFN